jgi:hypothetical protein
MQRKIEIAVVSTIIFSQMCLACVEFRSHQDARKQNPKTVMAGSHAEPNHLLRVAATR